MTPSLPLPAQIRMARAALVFLTLALPPAGAQAAERAVPQSRAEVTLSFAPVVKKAAPAVVNVYASRTDRTPRNALFEDPIFRHFFGDSPELRPGGPTAQSLGSGVLVDPSGLVVTNYHVIQGMTDVRVALSDRREFEADIVLRDQRTDLAVLRLKGGGPFPYMEFDDSDALEVGDIVLAIGDPFGVGETVTQGIVSALARTEEGISHYGFFIQTDAAINPGNSGGALIDMDGRLVGINSAIVSQTGSSVGIGFAIPSDMVKIIVATAKSGGKEVKRPVARRRLAERHQRDRRIRSGSTVRSECSSPTSRRRARPRRRACNTAISSPASTSSRWMDRRGVQLSVRNQAARLGGFAGRAPRRQTVGIDGEARLPPPSCHAIRSRSGVTSPFAGATVINISPAVAEEYSLELGESRASSSAISMTIHAPPCSACRRATWFSPSTTPRS